MMQKNASKKSPKNLLNVRQSGDHFAKSDHTDSDDQIFTVQKLPKHSNSNDKYINWNIVLGFRTRAAGL